MERSYRHRCRDAALAACAAGALPPLAYATFSMLVEMSNAAGDPIERKRATIGRYISRAARTVTRWTGWLEREGWLAKTPRRRRLPSGQYRGLSSRYQPLIPDAWSRVGPALRRERPPRPPTPNASAAGSVLVGIPPHRTPRPDRPISALETRVAAIVRRSHGP